MRRLETEPALLWLSTKGQWPLPQFSIPQVVTNAAAPDAPIPCTIRLPTKVHRFSYSNSTAPPGPTSIGRKLKKVSGISGVQSDFSRLRASTGWIQKRAYHLIDTPFQRGGSRPEWSLLLFQRFPGFHAAFRTFLHRPARCPEVRPRWSANWAQNPTPSGRKATNLPHVKMGGHLSSPRYHRGDSGVRRVAGGGGGYCQVLVFSLSGCVLCSSSYWRSSRAGGCLAWGSF